MARTPQQIFDIIITEKETFSSLDELVPNPEASQTFLQDLTSTSKVAIWRLKFWVIAVAIFIHESLFDQHVTEVEDRAKEITPGVTPWYVSEAKDFQLGDEFVFNEDTRVFEYEDTTSAEAIAKQIIEQASARDVNTVVTLKVAKDDGSGGLEKLTASEKTAFEAYLTQFKIAGTKTFVISDDPDLLKLAYTIQFDPLVLKVDGTLIEDATSPVQEAIDAYIEGLPFDSTFRVQDLTDAIQSARGVVNAVADVVATKFAALTFEDILAVPTQDNLPNAGYYATDPSPIIIATPVAWSAAVSYLIGDPVRFEGIVYEALTNNTNKQPDENPTDWETVSNLTFLPA